MLNYNADDLTPFTVNNGFAPKIDEGPRSLHLKLDFANDSQIYVDCSKPQANGVIGQIQAIHVDNSQNAAALVVTVLVTGQRIVFPAGAVNTWPLISQNPCQLVFSTTQQALTIRAELLNVPLAPASMGPITVNTSVAATGSFTDSAQLAGTGATAILFAANALRKGLLIQNPATNAASIWINFGAAATAAPPSIEIAPGQSYVSAAFYTTQQVQVIAPAAQVYSAKELA